MNKKCLGSSLDSKVAQSLPIRTSCFGIFKIVAFKVLGISKIHGGENKKFQNHLFISFYFTMIVSNDSDGFHLLNT